MKVSEVLVACYTTQSDYYVVKLADGRFAFVWGNIDGEAGSTLPTKAVADPTCDKGITLHQTYGAAAQAYCECADALKQTGEPEADAMMAALPNEVEI